MTAPPGAGYPLPAFVASLRVYQPLAAFEGEERRRWERYLAGGSPFVGSAGCRRGVAVERAAALRAAAGAVPAVLPAREEHAFVTEVDGLQLLCPWRSRLRALEALDAFASGLPDEVAEAYAPRAVLDSVEGELVQARTARPEVRSHVLTRAWEVPLRWFVLVDPEERRLSLGGTDGPAAGGSGGTTAGSAPAGRLTGRELLYRTPMARARRRVARALAVLRRTVEDGAVPAGVEEVGRWLEEFHPRSLVELDYGGLVHLVDDDELTADESARDVAVALAALAEGEQLRAAAAYSRVTSRMKALQAVESAN
jgi:hypothetical protein